MKGTAVGNPGDRPESQIGISLPKFNADLAKSFTANRTIADANAENCEEVKLQYYDWFMYSALPAVKQIKWFEYIK